MSLSLSAATDLAAAPTPSAASIAKLLASPKSPVRNRGVELLSTLLPSLHPVPDSTLLKIWKGLFFCFWHADKTLYQSSLATSIASIVSSNGPDLASQFLDASLLTLRREWGNIDYLRMDKFYLLVRRIITHTFQLLASNSWDLSLVSRVLEIIEERALGPEGTKGFSYHVTELFLDELVKFLPVTKETLEVLLSPFLRILEKSTDSVLVNKVRAEVFARFLVNGGKYLGLKKEGAGIGKGSEVEKFGNIVLAMGFSNKLLDVAKREETVQENKQILHDLRESFFKLEKDLEKSGVEISLPKMVNDAAKIENGEELGEKLPKKRKKEKNEAAERKEKKTKEKKKKKKKMKTKESNEGMLVRESNTELEDHTDSGTKEDKENERGREDMINLDETLISNLQKQFEKVAAEAGMSAENKFGNESGLENINALETTPLNTSRITKKRKQAKSADMLEMSSELELSSENGNTGTNGGGGGNMSSSVKKVRFSMKNNLVWKPSTPMPPHSLRVPPSATPRGSALKKGVPPGPIRDISSPTLMKRRKPKAKSAKKGLIKGSKSPSMAVKRLRKLQSLSA